MRRSLSIALAAAAAIGCGGRTPAPAPTKRPPPGPPVAPIHEVRDVHFGIAAVDPYRWMEDLASAAMQTWLHGQADYTRARLDAIPGRAALRARVHALDEASDRVTRVQRAGGRFFSLDTAAGQDQPKLYVRDAAGGAARLLVDPDASAAPSGAHLALDWFVASPDGTKVAYGVSPGGSEDSTIHVIDVATGAVLPDAIDRAQYAALAWLPDGRSFFTWRRQRLAADARPDETYRDSQVYLHVLGADPEGEAPVLGRGTPGVDAEPDWFPQVATYAGSRWAIGSIIQGVEPELRVYAAPIAAVAPGKTPWQQIFDFGDAVTEVAMRGDDLYAVSHAGASRYFVEHVKLGAAAAKPDVVVPASQRVVLEIAAAQDALYVTQRDGAVMRVLRVVPGHPPVELALPYDGTAELVTDPAQPGAYVILTSWTRSPALYAYDPARGTFTDTHVIPASAADFSDVESVEAEAVSADGTRVPLSIIRPKGLALDGSHPTIVKGYGAYGSVYDPFFDPTLHAWLEQGGVYAIAHVRGGGEYGEDWHQAGRAETKQHTFDDFYACAQYLIDQRYTTSARLAAEGKSAGGILVGNAIVQRPALFAAVLVRVGAVDIARFEHTAGGPANVPEYGSEATEAGWKVLTTIDAYLHVRDGESYPAVLLTAGANDPRVPPWMPAKLAARLQRASASGKPVLLRVDFDAGHGLGATRAQTEDELADEWSFLLWQMSVPAFQPR